MQKSAKTMTRGRTADGTFTAVREPGEALTREELAAMLSDVLKKLHARVTATRFVAKDSDRAMMEITRGLVSGAAALGSLIKDREMEDFEERLAALEARRNDRQ